MNLETTQPRSRQRFPGARFRSLVMACMLIMAMVVGAGLDRYAITSGLAGSQDSVADLSLLEEAYELIRAEYVDSDNVSDETLIYGAADGMLASLNDTGHSAFYSPAEADRWIDQTYNSSLVGLGVRLDYSQLKIQVISVIPNSPAEEAGVLPGDIILAIDGEDMTQYANETELSLAASELLRGEDGEEVVLTIERAEEIDPLEITVVRGVIEIDPVAWTMLPGNIVWLQLTQFTDGSALEVRKAMQEAREAGAEAMIFDLRNNGGGIITEEVAIVSQFLPHGSPIYIETSASGQERTIRTAGNDGAWQDLPVVVLMNEYTASAAEVTSSALRANDRAVLIGQTTVGTGTAVLPFRLSDGSLVTLGITKWMTADGEDVWRVGVDPDVEVVLEPGTFALQAFAYEDTGVDEATMATFNDDQLLAGYEQILQELQST